MEGKVSKMLFGYEQTGPGCRPRGRWNRLDKDCGGWINLLSRMVKRRLNVTLQDLGITAIQSRVMFYIMRRGAGVPAGRRTGVQPQPLDGDGHPAAA